MELDIDLMVDVDPEGEAALISSLPERYVAKLADRDSGNVRVQHSIRYADDHAQHVNTNAGVLIVEFLQGLGPCEDTIRRVGGELRLGIYYDLNETAVFPLRLSTECVRLMAKLNLSLDSTGYPCSEDGS